MDNETRKAVELFAELFPAYIMRDALEPRYPVLFHDEIAEILRGIPEGGIIRIYGDFPDTNAEYRKENTPGGTLFRETVSPAGIAIRTDDIVNILYDANENMTPIYINEKPLFE